MNWKSNLKLLAAFVVAGLCVTVSAVADTNPQADPQAKAKYVANPIVIQPDQRAAPTEPELSGAKDEGILTGSHIPCVYRRVGRTTDTIQPVIVIDRREFDRSGASTVGDILKRQSFASTPGR